MNPQRLPLLVMVTGAAPGLGKSTLSLGLAERMRMKGEDVELFEEQRILEQAEFAGLIEEWRSTGSAEEHTLIDSAAGYLHWCESRGASVYVLDSLFPHLPSLLAWGWSDSHILTFFQRLSTCMTGFDVVELHLYGNATLGLQRASDREGGGWLDWFVRKLGGYSDEGQGVSTAEDAVDYLECAAARSRSLMRQAPWPVSFIDADTGPSVALKSALRIVRPGLQG